MSANFFSRKLQRVRSSGLPRIVLSAAAGRHEAGLEGRSTETDLDQRGCAGRTQQCPVQDAARKSSSLASSMELSSFHRWKTRRKFSFYAPLQCVHILLQSSHIVVLRKLFSCSVTSVEDKDRILSFSLKQNIRHPM